MNCYKPILWFPCLKLDEVRMKFKVIIAHDSGYGGYVVDVPALVGCRARVRQ